MNRPRVRCESDRSCSCGFANPRKLTGRRSGGGDSKVTGQTGVDLRQRLKRRQFRFGPAGFPVRHLLLCNRSKVVPGKLFRLFGNLERHRVEPLARPPQHFRIRPFFGHRHGFILSHTPRLLQPHPPSFYHIRFRDDLPTLFSDWNPPVFRCQARQLCRRCPPISKAFGLLQHGLCRLLLPVRRVAVLFKHVLS